VCVNRNDGYVFGVGVCLDVHCHPLCSLICSYGRLLTVAKCLSRQPWNDEEKLAITF